MIFLQGWLRHVNSLRKTTNCVGDDSIFYFDRAEREKDRLVLCSRGHDDGHSSCREGTNANHLRWIDFFLARSALELWGVSTFSSATPAPLDACRRLTFIKSSHEESAAGLLRFFYIYSALRPEIVQHATSFPNVTLEWKQHLFCKRFESETRTPHRIFEERRFSESASNAGTTLRNYL